MTRPSASPPKIPAPQRTRRSAAQPASRSRKTVVSEIDGDSLEFPVAVTHRILAERIVRGCIDAVGLGHRRVLREMGGRLNVGRALAHRRIPRSFETQHTVPEVHHINTVTLNLFQLAPFRTRSEEHTSELQSLMRTSYAVFCLKKKK